MSGRVAVVAGGAGAVGGGVVAAFLDAGAAVAVPARSPERLSALRGRVGEAVETLEADIGTPDGAAAVRDEVLAKHGRIDVVVAAVGGWWSGPNAAYVDLETWRSVVDSRVTPHFVLARAFLPAMGPVPGAVYAMVVGDTDVAPAAGASLTTVTAAAVMGLWRALSVEHAAEAVRLLALHLGPVATFRTSNPDPRWFTAREVGEAVVRVAADPAATSGVVELRERPA